MLSWWGRWNIDVERYSVWLLETLGPHAQGVWPRGRADRAGIRVGEITESVLLPDAAVVGWVCLCASLFFIPYHDFAFYLEQ